MFPSCRILSGISQHQQKQQHGRVDVIVHKRVRASEDQQYHIDPGLEEVSGELMVIWQLINDNMFTDQYK